MKKELDMVADFHRKFGSPVLSSPSLISKERATFRHSIMAEEVKEYLDGVGEDDLPNIAKELADILYVVYGTVLEHGLQERMEDIFAEVHASNMSKEPNEFKAIKGKDYFKADIKKFFKDE